MFQGTENDFSENTVTTRNDCA
jgi:hypothetical protein